MVLKTLPVWHIPKYDGTFEASGVNQGGTQTVLYFGYVSVLTFLRKKCELEPQASALPSIPASREAEAGNSTCSAPEFYTYGNRNDKNESRQRAL